MNADYFKIESQHLIERIDNLSRPFGEENVFPDDSVESIHRDFAHLIYMYDPRIPLLSEVSSLYFPDPLDVHSPTWDRKRWLIRRLKKLLPLFISYIEIPRN